jgi:hypothetical protein
MASCEAFGYLIEASGIGCSASSRLSHPPCAKCNHERGRIISISSWNKVMTPQELYNHSQYEIAEYPQLYISPFFEPEVDPTLSWSFAKNDGNGVEVRAYYESSADDIRSFALFYNGNPFMYGTTCSEFSHPCRHITNVDIYVMLASKMNEPIIRESIENCVCNPSLEGPYISGILASAAKTGSQAKP